MVARQQVMNRFSGALALMAIAGPTLWGPDAPPMVSFRVEVFALLAWGIWLATLPRGEAGFGAARSLRRASGIVAVAAALALLMVCVAGSVALAGWPLVIGLRHGFILLAVAATLSGGICLSRTSSTDGGTSLLETVLLCFVFAGLAHGVIAVLQYLGVEGWWPAMGQDGRAKGALSQPNLLGTQLLWAYVALVALLAGGRMTFGPVLVCAALLIVSLALSASRTAALSCLALVAWGLMDRQLDRRSRALLLVAPLALLLCWAALNAWQSAGGPGFAGTSLLHKTDPTSSRWGLWKQCARLIMNNPWWGVGWGQFNLAWSLTPMPGLPRTAGYTFTHAHNLFVHWAVELGLPLAIVVSGLLVCAIFDGVRRLWRAEKDVPVVQRAALVMVLIVAVHSQLEFPLWWVNFLLPTAFLLGVALAGPAATYQITKSVRRWPLGPWLMIVGAAFAWVDHLAIADVYRPGPDSPPQAQRIAVASQSLLFGHFGDRFAATLAPAGTRQIETYQRIVFEMLDERLLASWALAHAEAGQADKAQFLASRLREFGSASAQQFFAVCVSEPQRFQCAPSDAPLGFRSFR